ncbi:hypothetical protein [Myroides sp. N17-2]|uniref:hypothetical protein n=1 Tax=Myroides sp. N17-2 TaxID=2030799 RepID=UPI0011814306|nr:hypothetical protein [Myroides sp. N17-2]
MMTKSTAQAFIEKNFSLDFIEKAKKQTIVILNTLYYDFSIKKYEELQSIPTDDFNTVNCDDGYPSEDTSELINTFLHNRKFDENEILYLTISFITSSRFQNLIDNITIYDNEEFDHDLLEVLLAKHVSKQLPLYLFDYLRASVIKFCSEFDMSDGLIENEHFEDMQEYYSFLLAK